MKTLLKRKTTASFYQQPPRRIGIPNFDSPMSKLYSVSSNRNQLGTVKSQYYNKDIGTVTDNRALKKRLKQSKSSKPMRVSSAGVNRQGPYQHTAPTDNTSASPHMNIGKSQDLPSSNPYTPSNMNQPTSDIMEDLYKANTKLTNARFNQLTTPQTLDNRIDSSLTTGQPISLQQNINHIKRPMSGVNYQTGHTFKKNQKLRKHSNITDGVKSLKGPRAASSQARYKKKTKMVQSVFKDQDELIRGTYQDDGILRGKKLEKRVSQVNTQSLRFHQQHGTLFPQSDRKSFVSSAKKCKRSRISSLSKKTRATTHQKGHSLVPKQSLRESLGQMMPDQHHGSTAKIIEISNKRLNNGGKIRAQTELNSALQTQDEDLSKLLREQSIGVHEVKHSYGSSEVKFRAGQIESGMHTSIEDDKLVTPKLSLEKHFKKKQKRPLSAFKHSSGQKMGRFNFHNVSRHEVEQNHIKTILNQIEPGDTSTKKPSTYMGEYTIEGPHTIHRSQTSLNTSAKKSTRHHSGKRKIRSTSKRKQSRFQKKLEIDKQKIENLRELFSEMNQIHNEKELKELQTQMAKDENRGLESATKMKSLISNLIEQRVSTSTHGDDQVFTHEGVDVNELTRKMFRSHPTKLQEYFDPLRSKIKVLPTSLATPIGRNADFFFKEGCKHFDKQEYPHAIEMFKKGIDTRHDSYLNRFNLGATMFKLGLFSEALQQYQDLQLLHPEKVPIYENKAMCELQTGQFYDALDSIEICLELLNYQPNYSRVIYQNKKTKKFSPVRNSTLIELLEDNDKHLIYDLYTLKGVCEMRLMDMRAASQSFETAKKFYVDYRVEDGNILSNFSPEVFTKEEFGISPERVIDDEDAYSQQEKGTRSKGFSLVQQDIKVNQSQVITPIVNESFKQSPNTKDQNSLSFAKGNKTDELRASHQQLIQISQISQIPDTAEPIEINQIESEILSEKQPSQDTSLHTPKNIEEMKQQSKKLKKLIKKQFNASQLMEDHSSNGSTEVERDYYLIDQNKNMRMEIIMGLHKLKGVDKIDEATDEEKKEILKRKQYELDLLGIDADVSEAERKVMEEEIKKQNEDFYLEHLLKIDEKNLLRQSKPSHFNMKDFGKVEGNLEKLKQQLDKRMNKTGEFEAYQGQYSPNKLQIKSQDDEKDEQGGLPDFIENGESEAVNVQRMISEQRNFIQRQEERKVYEKQEAALRAAESGKGVAMTRIPLNQVEMIVEEFNKPCQECSMVEEVAEDEVSRQVSRIEEGEEGREGEESEKTLDEGEQEGEVNQTSHSEQVVSKAKPSPRSSPQSEDSLPLHQSPETKVDENTQDEIPLQTPTPKIDLSPTIPQYRDWELLDGILRELKFFKTFPENVRKKVLRKCNMEQFTENQIVYNQGESGYFVYVIVRGCVKIKMKKAEYGDIPIVISTLYDGDHIGEMALFEKSDNLNQDLVDELNKRRETAIACEDTLVVKIDKRETQKIFNSEQNNFESRIDFLQSIDLFQDIDMFILLSLVNNIRVKHYSYGEYIVREGQQPEGLYIISKGQCLVVSEKLGIRSSKPSRYARIQNANHKKNVSIKPTGGTLGDYEPDSKFTSPQKGKTALKLGEPDLTKFAINQIGNPRILGYEEFKADHSKLNMVRNRNRAFQNERIFADDNGNQIDEYIVYKDLMIFFKLVPRNHFGGRILLPDTGVKQTVDEKYEEQERMKGSIYGKQKKQGSKPKSKHAQKMNDPRTSLLSVIADSGSVEVFLIEKQHLNFFPEYAQKDIFKKIEEVFEADRPYTHLNVEKIKGKFREWDVFKVKTCQDFLKTQYIDRKKDSILNLDR